MPIACGQSGRGSDSPPDCHSLPRLRFAHPLHKGAFALPKPTVTIHSRAPRAFHNVGRSKTTNASCFRLAETLHTAKPCFISPQAMLHFFPLPREKKHTGVSRTPACFSFCFFEQSFPSISMLPNICSFVNRTIKNFFIFLCLLKTYFRFLLCAIIDPNLRLPAHPLAPLCKGSWQRSCLRD